MRCPNCKSKNLGKIATNHYYCWDCFIELTIANDRFEMHQVEEDGSLTSLNDLFDDYERMIQY